MLCIALVEAAEPLTRQLVTLSSDGLLPPSLSRASSRTTAPATAHLTGGLLAAVLALVTSHVFLLQVRWLKVVRMLLFHEVLALW